MKWICVTERMPEAGKDVLFCDSHGDIKLGYHLDGATRTHFTERGSWDMVKNVVAWMPLPESYKGE